MQSSVDAIVVTRARNTSPTEELLLRLQTVGPLLKLADHEMVALLHESRIERVEEDGAIRFEIAGQKHEYYAADSPTCQNQRGKKVLVAYSRTFTDAIFVILPNKKWIDTIPLKCALRWFDYDKLGAEIREQETVLKRASKELAELHGADIERRVYAGRGNVERVEGWREARIVNTFPASTPHEDSGADNSEPTRSGGESARPLSTDVPRYDRGEPANAELIARRPSTFTEPVLPDTEAELLQAKRQSRPGPPIQPRGEISSVASQIAAAAGRCSDRIGAAPKRAASARAIQIRDQAALLD